MVENIEQQVDKAQGHVEIAAVSTKQAIEYKKVRDFELHSQRIAELREEKQNLANNL